MRNQPGSSRFTCSTAAQEAGPPLPARARTHLRQALYDCVQHLNVGCTARLAGAATEQSELDAACMHAYLDVEGGARDERGKLCYATFLQQPLSIKYSNCARMAEAASVKACYLARAGKGCIAVSMPHAAHVCPMWAILQCEKSKNQRAHVGLDESM